MALPGIGTNNHYQHELIDRSSQSSSDSQPSTTATLDQIGTSRSSNSSSASSIVNSSEVLSHNNNRPLDISNGDVARSGDITNTVGGLAIAALGPIQSTLGRLTQIAISAVFTREPPGALAPPSPTIPSSPDSPKILSSPTSTSASSLSTPSSGKRQRVAVIGAGVTGVTSAAHLVTHGFDVVLFDRHDRLGGIWYDVNETSSLQLHSFCYRFHPSVVWSSGTSVYQPEILSEIERVWNDYELASRTRFNYNVNEIARFKSVDGSTKYIINEGDEGQFDGLILAVGTCGVPRSVNFKGRSSFKGQWVHSSQLENIKWNDGRGRNLVCLGGGASGVEVIETVLDRLDSKPVLVTRSDKWFIPRHLFFSVILAHNPLGFRTLIDGFCEKMIEMFHYGSQLKFMVPKRAVQSSAEKEATGLFDQTPIVNDKFLELVRTRKVDYVQAEVVQIHENAVEIRPRESSEKSKTQIIPADIIVESTGYERPEIKYPAIRELFQNPGGGIQDYSPPNLFLGNITVNDWSCMMINSSYVHGIGSVGHFHIGIFNRMLMMFLVDETTRPKHLEMKKWVDQKSREKERRLNCYTYAELMIWLVTFMVFDINRLPWLVFVIFGFGEA